MRCPSLINQFKGDYAFLSNFYPAEVYLNDLGYTDYYKTVEHAYQASKTLDRKERIRIKKMSHPGMAKRVGNRIALRDDWEDVKLDVMYIIVKRKFVKHTDLRLLLIKTGQALLVEGNYWDDVFWGVCRGVGENHLGKILMRVRKELRRNRLRRDWWRELEEVHNEPSCVNS